MSIVIQDEPLRLVVEPWWRGPRGKSRQQWRAGLVRCLSERTLGWYATREEAMAAARAAYPALPLDVA